MKTFKYILIGLVALVLFAGCAGSDTNEQGNQDAGQHEKLKIGVMSDVGAVPFFIASEKGFYEEAGVDVEIVVFKSALDRDAALQTGNLDATMADMLSIIFYNDADLPVKMVAQTDGDYLMITSPDLTIASFNQLASASVGVSSNTVIDFATDYIAKQQGISQRIQPIAIPQMPVRLEMLKSGKLKAATLPEPLASTAMIDGGEVIGTMSTYGLSPGILVFSDALASDEAVSKAIFKAYNDAAAWLNDNGSDAIYDRLVEVLGFSEVLRNTSVLPTYKAIAAPDSVTFEITSDWMYERGLTEQKYDFESISFTKYLPNADF
ncbi:MAG: NitT/TauT family transport system substrate-binding protein [Clostridiales bacterium]|jgi:NitT/TauT family transport system substrate-binding protein|nr:NitT/TauT family transport system substrate-binding protein [Clostridiales bacterium]MDN5297874.1 NitT/TauT family transport system substrate-binding protein [Clostridiales bacterium]